jgi:hypothetical protein
MQKQFDFSFFQRRLDYILGSKVDDDDKYYLFKGIDENLSLALGQV